MTLPPFEHGERVALRNIQPFPRRGRAVSSAVAGRIVSDGPEIVALCTPIGSQLRLRAGRGLGPNARIIPVDTWDGSYSDETWRSATVVRVHRRGDSWSVWRWHDGTDWTEHWYGNLESPWTRSAIGYDNRDWVLDVVATGTPGTDDWAVGFKDEDELAWMVDRGTITDEQAAYVRGVGDQLVTHAEGAGWPFDADWTEWLPNPEWTATDLPADWDVVDPG